MKSFAKIFLLHFLIAVLPVNPYAQQWSFVYIQGDKQTPFYVKLDDEMLPRYGKHFCIIPQLDPGPLHIQILFQQNEYPPQNFTILVPENGFRGFLLTRKENEFALYDIQQRFYLFPGAKGEDHLPKMISMPREQKEPAEVAKKKDEPLFIDNLELSNEQTTQSTTIEKQQVEKSAAEIVVPDSSASEIVPEEDQTPSSDGVNLSENATFENKNCPQPLRLSAFNNLLGAVREHASDEERLAYLLSQVDEYCFSTQQVLLMGKEMNAEEYRYVFLKKIFPRVADQQNFYLLEDHLFPSSEWKSYFRLIH